MTRHSAAIALLSALSGVIFFATATPGFAQRVWVDGGGVRVRAPFVRVDVGPYGGVSVRAPFAAVDVPPRAYYYESDYGAPYIIERRVVEPSFPTAAELTAMDADQLNQALRNISQRLHDRLARFDTGPTWQVYLQLSSEAVDASIPADERTAALAKLLDRFHKVAADPQYPMISGLPAFTAMAAALNEAVSRPDGMSPDATMEDLPLPMPGQHQPPSPQLPPQQRPATPQQVLPAPERPATSVPEDPFLQPTPRQ
jgi:hypothetical protein